MSCMDETAARRLQAAAEEILKVDQTQSEAQLRRYLGLPPRESAAAIPIPDGPKLGRILTHDDVRAIVREEIKPLVHSQAEALGAIDALASDVREVVSAVGGLRELLDSLSEALHGFRQLPSGVVAGVLPGTACGAFRGSCVTDGAGVRHGSSPSVGESGDLTVGDRQATEGDLSPSVAEPLTRADVPVIVDSIVELVAERMAAANTFHLECGPIKPVTAVGGLQHARFERTT